MIGNVFNFFKAFSGSDWILSASLVVIIWYSWETHLLRKWQKKQAQATLVNLVMQASINHDKLGNLHSLYPRPIREIYELGKLDLRDFFSDKRPLKFTDKLKAKFKRT